MIHDKILWCDSFFYVAKKTLKLGLVRLRAKNTSLWIILNHYTELQDVWYKLSKRILCHNYYHIYKQLLNKMHLINHYYTTNRNEKRLQLTCINTNMRSVNYHCLRWKTRWFNWLVIQLHIPCEAHSYM